MLRKLARVLLIVACVASLAQETTLGSLLFGDACSESCPGDIAPHRCPPGCTTCSCAVHGTTLNVISDATAQPPRAMERLVFDEAPQPADLRPDPVFPVPKPALA